MKKYGNEQIYDKIKRKMKKILRGWVISTLVETDVLAISRNDRSLQPICPCDRLERCAA